MLILLVKRNRVLLADLRLYHLTYTFFEARSRLRNSGIKGEWK